MRGRRPVLEDSLRNAGGSPAVRPPESFLSPEPRGRGTTQETQDMTSTKIRSVSPTARKVVGSLAVLGTAAAVAGLGTYGNFTDSTTPMNTTVASGTLSIDLTQPAGAYAIP